MNSITNNATHTPLSLNHSFDASHTFNANKNSSLPTQIQGNIALARVLYHLGKPVVQWMGQAATQGIQLAKASVIQFDQKLQRFSLPTANAETLRGQHRLLQASLSTQPTFQGLGSTITDCQFNSTVESTVGLGSVLTQSTFLGETYISTGATVSNAHFDQSVEIGTGCDVNQVTCRRAARFNAGSQVSQSHFEGTVDLAVNTEIQAVTANGRFIANAGSKVTIQDTGVIFNSDAEINIVAQMIEIPTHWLGLYAREKNNNYIFDQAVTISQDESGNLEIEIGSATASPVKPTLLPSSASISAPTSSPTRLQQTSTPTLGSSSSTTAAPSTLGLGTTPPPPPVTNSIPAYTSPPWVDGDRPNRSSANNHSAAEKASPSLITTLAVAGATMLLSNQLNRN